MSIDLPEDLQRALTDLSRRLGTTRAMLLLAALVLLVRGETGRDRFVLGISHAGRLDPAARRVAGCFTRTLPLSIECLDDEPCTGLIARLAGAVIRGQERAPGGRGAEALPSIGFNQPPQYGHALSGLESEPVEVGLHVARCELTLIHSEGYNRWTGLLYERASYPGAVVRRLGRRYLAIASQLASFPASRQGDLVS